MRIVIALMLSFPAAAMADGPGAYYFIAVQNGAYNFKGGEAQLEESYKALQGMVKLADAQNARLTLLFSAQYAVYIASDPVRLVELEGWKKTGHEVGAYHQGPDTRAWDGYSDLPAEALGRLRKDSGKSAASQGHAAYFGELARLDYGIKAGCMQDWKDKQFRAAAPAYEICGRPGDKGINNFVAVSGEEKPGKKLSVFHPADKAGILAARKDFAALSSGVYGASFKSSPSEFGAFYSWLSFLKGKDPQGLRSRTVSSAVEGGLLAEKKAGAAPKPVKKEEKIILKPEPEAPQAGIPRLRPVQPFYGKVGTLLFGRRAGGKNPEQRTRCGDGLCDAFERAQAGRCPSDCGH